MRSRIFYGWVVVAVAAIVVLVTAGVRSAPGAFLLSMTDEHGWSTASVSFAAAAAAGWIAIVAGFAALMIRRREQAPAVLQAA